MYCFIDIIKAFACLLIVNFHSLSIYPDKLKVLSFGGDLGNNLFFLISGFTLYCSIVKTKKSDAWKWVIKRYWRIFPMVLSLEFVSFGLETQELSFEYISKSFVFPTFFWFTGAIVLFYPLLFLYEKMANSYTLIIISAILIGTHLLYDSLWTERYLIGFLAMVIGCELRIITLKNDFSKSKINSKALWIGASIIFSGIYVILKLVYSKQEILGRFIHLSIGLATVFIAFSVVMLGFIIETETLKKRNNRVFLMKFVKMISKSTLSIYLVQQVINRYFIDVFESLQFPKSFIVYLAMLLGISFSLTFIDEMIHKLFRKKDYILIFCLNRRPWIGGIYYRKNILNMILQNKEISQKYKIVVLVNKKYEDIFTCFEDKIELVICPDNIGVAKVGIYSLSCCWNYAIKYVFPLKPISILKIMGIIPVSWIADFQHCHYPDFFEKEEIGKRNCDFRMMARAQNPLVLSSNDALNDFEKFFAKDRKNVYVVHFTSCIFDELKKIQLINANDIMLKYGLESGKYFLISNQFWQHKNHITAIEAFIRYKGQVKNGCLKMVLTGELSDRRNPEYIEKIKSMLNNKDIKDDVVLAGFVDRTEQLILMKESLFVVQPSLFEGWGTVVEDAKVLNKRMILSDIDVHKEQMNDKCVLFSKNDSQDLCDKIIKMSRDDLIKDMLEIEDKTLDYSIALEKVFS